jgi:glycoprotein 3-alpha-L-fucosyltransferase
VLQAVANVRIVVATNFSNINEDATDVVEMSLPWYVTGGTRRPLPAAKSRISGRRMAQLWPEEAPGSYRITNQLMFVPPSATASESSGQSLKKILFYYGLNRAYNLNLGRKNFIDARCPVDTCTITLDKNQTTVADAIVYYGRYAYPSFPRPPRQVRVLNLLYSRSYTESRDRVLSPTFSA